MAPYNFEVEGGWNPATLRGSVYDVPNDIRNLQVAELHAQWLSSYEEGDEEASKNHMCFRLRLPESVWPVGLSFSRRYGGIACKMMFPCL